MNVFQAVILGLIQGITEFLPVSSSGHLVLFQKLFNINQPTILFDIILHIGTLVPVIIIFWDKIFSLIKKPFEKYTWLIILATLPAVIIGLFFGNAIENLFNKADFLWLAFIITGVVLLCSDSSKISKAIKSDKDILYKDALIIGLMQAFAIIPGVSRSGSTIAAALICGLKKNTAARFSFMMSIPVIIGASVLELKHVFDGEINYALDFKIVFFGFIAAALSGYLAIKFMLNLIRQSKLKYFAYYVFILAFFILLDKIFFGLYF